MLQFNENEDSARASKRYCEIAEELIEYGEPGIACLANLLQDKREEVRAAAAAFLLPYRTSEALRVLEEASKGKGLVVFGAIATLGRWRAGEDEMWKEISHI